jgi:hypothetical protein
VFIAGDDATAKATVSDLVKATEFEPVDSGTLYNSRFLEPMGEMNILLGFFLGWGASGAPEYRRSENPASSRSPSGEASSSGLVNPRCPSIPSAACRHLARRCRELS